MFRVFNADRTCVYGPVSEERSISLHVPAVSRSMHPWNLEYPLLLQAKNMQNVSQAKTHPACVHAVTCKRQTTAVLTKTSQKDTYLVDPFEPRDFTRVYLLLQPRPHTHSLYRHAGLEKESETRERSGICQSLTATFPPSTGCTFLHDFPGRNMTNFNPTSKNKPPGETI